MGAQFGGTNDYVGFGKNLVSMNPLASRPWYCINRFQSALWATLKPLHEHEGQSARQEIQMKAINVNTGYTSAQTTAVLVGSSIMLSMSMGMRQSWGLFSGPVTQDLGITVADFMLAIAIQNIVWGISQPVIGAYADNFGCRLIGILGTLLYAAGIGVTMAATGTVMLIIGLGAMIGLAMSCTALMLALAASARAVSPVRRSMVLGIISAMGSIGAFVAAPLAEGLISSHGWMIAMVAFLGL